MVDAQQPVLFFTTVLRQLSEAVDSAGGTLLSQTLGTGGSGGKEHTHRAQSALGCPHYEQELMRKETFYGVRPEVWILIILVKIAVFCGAECCCLFDKKSTM